MRQFLAIAALSVLAFAAGYGVRVWVNNTSALPPPPPVGGEFAASPSSATAATNDKPAGLPHPSREELVAQIGRLRPQIEIYRATMSQIDVDFDRDLQAMLTPVQQGRYDERHRRRAASSILRPDDTRPLTDDEILRLRDLPLWNALEHISVQWKLDDLNKDIKFDDAQLPKLRELLLQRREKFLKLMDSVPAPSLLLSRLAPVVQRLAQPKP
jgi:hypothetical protein